MKSKLSKKFGTGIVVLLITVCFIPALAGAFVPGDGRQDMRFERRGHHRSPLGIWRDPQIVNKLGLSAEQVKQIREADFTFREKCLLLKAQLDGLHLKMDKAFSDDILGNAVVLSLAKKIADVKGKLFVQEVGARLTVGKLLHADQIKKLKLLDRHQNKQRRLRGKKHISGRNSADRPDHISSIDDLKE